MRETDRVGQEVVSCCVLGEAALMGEQWVGEKTKEMFVHKAMSGHKAMFGRLSGCGHWTGRRWGSQGRPLRVIRASRLLACARVRAHLVFLFLIFMPPDLPNSTPPPLPATSGNFARQKSWEKLTSAKQP